MDALPQGAQPTPAPDHPGRDPENQVDPTTPTGLYHVVSRRYGKRASDRPLWWVFAYHLVKALAALLPYVAAAALFKACGFELPHPGGK